MIYVYWNQMLKSCFVLHSCQFVVKAGKDYAVHAIDPDTLVEWDLIEQVVCWQFHFFVVFCTLVFFLFFFFFLFILIHFSCILFRVKWNSNKLSSFSTNLSSFEQFESTFVITHQLGFLNVFKRDESLCVSLLIKTTTRSCKNKLVDLFLKRSSFFRDFLHLCNVLFAWYLFVVRLSFEHAKGRKSLSMPLVSAISFQLALQSVLINVWNVVIYVDCVPVYFHFPMYFGNQVLDTKQRLNLLFNLS